MSTLTPPESLAVIAIPLTLREQIYAHARRCFPAECCGYLRGPATTARASASADDAIVADAIVECRNVHGDGDHPTTPDRGDDSAFVIAGTELIAFARSFDTPSPARVVYHSHTNGRAYFSAVDRDVATTAWNTATGPTYPVQHLVVGLTELAIVEAAQFAWSDTAREWIEIARWQIRSGADVTGTTSGAEPSR
jgi:proteasome lid subunit RPN8/RPN11